MPVRRAADGMILEITVVQGLVRPAQIELGTIQRELETEGGVLNGTLFLCVGCEWGL